MEYNVRERILNGCIKISECQAEVLEILIKMDGKPIKGPEITREIEKKRGVTLYSNNVTTYIKRINKKTDDLIKNKPFYGYYIDEEIKIW